MFALIIEVYLVIQSLRNVNSGLLLWSNILKENHVLSLKDNEKVNAQLRSQTSSSSLNWCMFSSHLEENPTRTSTTFSTDFHLKFASGSLFKAGSTLVEAHPFQSSLKRDLRMRQTWREQLFTLTVSSIFTSWNPMLKCKGKCGAGGPLIPLRCPSYLGDLMLTWNICFRMTIVFGRLE